MKLQFEILFFILCLNLIVGAIIILDLGGAQSVMATNPYSDAEEIEEHFNATDIASGWQSTPFQGIPILGDLFAGFSFMFTNIGYLLDGFPCFLTWVKDSFIVDAGARVAFDVVANILRGLFAVLMSWMFIEFISGRVMTR